MRIRHSDNVPTRASITPIRAASGHEFLAAETDASTPPVAGDHANFDFIDELHEDARAAIIAFLRAKKKPQTGLFLDPFKWSLLRENADPFSLLVEPVIKNYPINFGEKGVVPAHTDVSSRVDASTDLANDDVSGPDRLAAKNLHSAPLPLAVSTVARAAAGFFMSHRQILLCVDSNDF